MFLATRIGWAGIAFTLLATGMLVTGLPRSAAGSDSNQKGVVAFVIKNEFTFRRKKCSSMSDCQKVSIPVEISVGQPRLYSSAYILLKNLIYNNNLFFWERVWRKL